MGIHSHSDMKCYNCTFIDLYHDIPKCALNESVPNDMTPCKIGCVKMEVDLEGEINNFAL